MIQCKTFINRQHPDQRELIFQMILKAIFIEFYEL